MFRMTFGLLLLLIPFVAKAERPNILIIMADDLGYSDLGCYGGEIQTPHLDRLAADGTRFTQFYNTAKCHSSRVSLLTGQYCLAAGDTSLRNAVTSAEVLQTAGYFTAMTGKWHLKEQPTDFGFQRYFGHLSGACNYFRGDRSFRLDGEPWQVPEESFYTTVANVDFAIDFVDSARQTDKPWYLYVAFNAPHAPLHALPEDYAKYRGRYLKGWDQIRNERVANQKRIGLLPEDTVPSPRPEHVPAWEDLPKNRQRYEANRMSTLAAMIDRMDREIGRLISDLESHDELDDTLIVFVSDNGACPYDRRRPVLDIEPTSADRFFGDSTGWSWARNSPFRYYKQNQFEGGISSPAIFHWPNGLDGKSGRLIHEPAHLIDILPTLVEVTRSEIPAAWPKRNLRPVSGVSIAPLLRGESFHREHPLHFQFSSDRGLRQGDWKLVSFRGEAWELYDLSRDRTELNDVAGSEPERLQSMIRTWTRMARDVLHAEPSVYGPVKQSQLPHRHPEWTKFDEPFPGPVNSRRTAKFAGGIRARRNTRVEIREGRLELQFSGDDPGIAMDLRQQEIPPGPYVLEFRLRGGTPDAGDIFFTTSPGTTLPRGTRVRFAVKGGGQWQEVRVPLKTRKKVLQVRLDCAEGTGTAAIDNLALRTEDGRILLEWPLKN